MQFNYTVEAYEERGGTTGIWGHETFTCFERTIPWVIVRGNFGSSQTSYIALFA